MGSAAWNDADLLARRLGSWHHRFAGRDLFRVTAGPGWVRLQFAGDDRAGVLLTDLPGARLVTEVAGRLPESVVAALPLAPRHALVSLLGQARLTGCGLLPDDRVAAFRFARPGADDVVLLHRLFGSRGNTVLLDTGAHLLWS
ncbi:hypothetical protein KDM41_01960, partial [bacterium]|nr:hypothetical protein [bacterium]